MTITYQEMITQLMFEGWSEIRCKGSHHQFKHYATGFVVTVPGRKKSEIISQNVVKNIEKTRRQALRV